MFVVLFVVVFNIRVVVIDRVNRVSSNIENSNTILSNRVIKEVVL